MYTIIGGDGREYGPVSPEQIRQWIAAGRANGDTRAKVFGTEEWKTLRDFPEFAPAPAFPTEPPPSFSGTAPAASALPASPEQFDPIECLSRSWDLLRRNFWPLIGICLLMWVVYFGISAVSGAILPVATAINPHHISAYLLGAHFIFSIGVSFLIGQPLQVGLHYYFIRKARGEEPQISDLFAGFTRAYVPLVLGTIVMCALCLAGCLCLVLPGIYLLVAYSLAQVTIVDQRCGFWAGLELSRRAITQRWWAYFLLLILFLMVLLIGVVALLVGVFVAYPLIIGAMAYAYLDLVPGARTPHQVVQGDLPRPEREQDNKGV